MMKCFTKLTYTMGAFSDLDFGLSIAQKATEYGVDGFSAPQVMAFALELLDNGILTDADFPEMPEDSEGRFYYLLDKIVRREGISLEKLHPGKLETGESGADIMMENQEAGELIRFISCGLPEKQQLVFSLRDLQEFSSQEVQEITGMSEDAIKSNLYHARKAVRDRLAPILSFERKLS